MKKILAVVSLTICFLLLCFAPILAAVSDEQLANNSDNSDNSDNLDNSDNSDNSITIIVDGDNNLIIIANDGVTVAPPVDPEDCPGPAVYDVQTATFIVPNVKVVDVDGVSTMFTRVVLCFDANGVVKLLWVDQE